MHPQLRCLLMCRPQSSSLAERTVLRESIVIPLKEAEYFASPSAWTEPHEKHHYRMQGRLPSCQRLAARHVPRDAHLNLSQWCPVEGRRGHMLDRSRKTLARQTSSMFISPSVHGMRCDGAQLVPRRRFDCYHNTGPLQRVARYLCVPGKQMRVLRLRYKSLYTRYTCLVVRPNKGQHGAIQSDLLKVDCGLCATTRVNSPHFPSVANRLFARTTMSAVGWTDVALFKATGKASARVRHRFFDLPNYQRIQLQEQLKHVLYSSYHSLR